MNAGTTQYYTLYPWDPDGDSVTLFFDEQPYFTSFSASNELMLQTSYADGGTYEIGIAVQDPYITIYYYFDVTIVNDPAVFST